jgi:hypothetical protein
MKALRIVAPLGLALVALVAVTATADNRHRHQEVVSANLTGFGENPTLSSTGTGRFRAVIDEDAGTIDWTLSYDALGSTVQQAHVHFGQRWVNGGISFFFCTNLGNAPAGLTVQACPAFPAEISGTITTADVIGPAAQGIAAGEFNEIVAAIRAGAAYANVHTTNFPGGEIRGQIHHAFR